MSDCPGFLWRKDQNLSIFVVLCERCYVEVEQFEEGFLNNTIDEQGSNGGNIAHFAIVRTIMWYCGKYGSGKLNDCCSATKGPGNVAAADIGHAILQSFLSLVAYVTADERQADRQAGSKTKSRVTSRMKSCRRGGIFLTILNYTKKRRSK